MTQQVKDIRLEIKVRNNLVLTRMEDAGITGIVELVDRMTAAGIKINRSQLYKLVSMKLPARKRNGDWASAVHRLADFFQCMPDDLFSEQQQYEKLEKNRAHAEVTYAEVQQLTARSQEPLTPELALGAKQLHEAVSKALQTLTPREERVVRMRFGFETGEEKTYEEIGESFSVTRERVRQIEAKALRKLKHPSRARLFAAAGGDRKIGDTSWGKRAVYSVDEEVLKAL